MTSFTVGITSKTASVVASVLLFLMIFVQWQIYDLIIMYFSLGPQVITLLYLSMPAFSLLTYAVFVKLTKSSFREHGYKPPDVVTPEKCLFISLILIAMYVIFALMPGIIGTFGFLQINISPISIFYRLANAVLFSMASESIFRGYIFRNLLGTVNFFPSLYASSLMFGLSQISIRNMLAMSSDSLTIYMMTDILTMFAMGLFLGFFYYKTDWSLLGPSVFRIGVSLFFEPTPISTASSPWWIGLTSEVTAFALMILLVDAVIIEPRYRRRQYGLES
ncbi:MAG: hypothetical protein NWF14_06865 [Candidatus Bathyarchaeota archaeon]|nr:hypothetical protein [Candidatus Bathyarchaeota archaeon]